MYKPIGAFEAKAQLSALLQAVKKGKRYTITIRGVPIADLVPTKSGDTPQDIPQAIENMRNIHKIHDVSAQAITQWIEEGRQ